MNKNTKKDEQVFRYDYADGFGYYMLQPEKTAEPGGPSNRERHELPLIFNCIGKFTSRYPFTTHRPKGRLDYQLMYILNGNITFFDGGRRVSAGAGSIVILPPHIEHKYSSTGGEELSNFWLHFTGSEADLRLKEYEIEAFPAVYETVPSDHITERFQRIIDAVALQDRYLERDLSALLDRLLITIARRVVRRGEHSSQLSVSLRYIRENYSKEIRIAELASLEHLSISRFNFVFKKQTGIPPTKYILKLRMASAAELLTSTDISVKQIGEMCGYYDAHFFSKVFKGYFGVCPNEYRNGQ